MVKRLKKVAFALVTACLAVGVAHATHGVFPIQVMGISPHDIEADALDVEYPDIRPTAGIPTVPVGHRVFLEAVEDSLNDVAWEITTAPVGSAVTGLTGTEPVLDFVVDLEGSYEVSLSVNAGATTATLWVTAAEFVGVGNIGGQTPSAMQGECASCHADKASDWQKHIHATATVPNLTLPYMNAGCMDCHSTGWDQQKWADDLGFTFPQPGVGVYDSVVTNHPDQAILFNVQCESCHGPGSQHIAKTSKNETSVSFKSATCAQCHDEPSHHPEPLAWDVSAHASYATIAGSGHANGANCSRCHTAQGFVAETINGGAAIAVAEPDPITCSACHDPHAGNNPAALRRASVGTSCNGCHTLRVSSRGLHHSHQGSMLDGKDGMELPGYDYPVSAHAFITDACAECHMAPLPDFITAKVASSELDPGAAARIVGGHTFKVVGEFDLDNDGTPDEFVNPTGCESCHGTVSMEFVRQSQNAIIALMDELQDILPKYVEGSVATGFVAGEPIFSGTQITAAEAAAAYNWYFVRNDGSWGVHNHDYAASLLRASIKEVQASSVPGEIVSVTDAPNDQGKVVRILWNAFPAENSATSKVVQYQIVRLDGALDEGAWVVVGEVSASGMDRYALDVATDYDSTAAAGVVLSEFKVIGITNVGTSYESQVASGYSVDNLVPMAPTNAKFVSEAGKLAWDPSVSEDVQYYAVYRTDLNGTITVDGNPYIMVADTAVAIEVGYRYGIVAVDFAGNVSELAAGATVDIVGIAASPTPATTALLGNAPNPFNPSTEIRYQLHEATKVTLVVYNVLGQPVRTVVSGHQAAGAHSVRWDGRDATGHNVSTGAYLYVMTTENGFRDTGRMLLLR